MHENEFAGRILLVTWSFACVVLSVAIVYACMPDCQSVSGECVCLPLAERAQVVVASYLVSGSARQHRLVNTNELSRSDDECRAHNTTPILDGKRCKVLKKYK